MRTLTNIFKFLALSAIATALLAACKNEAMVSDLPGRIVFSADGQNISKGTLVNDDAAFADAFAYGFGVSVYKVKDNAVYEGMENVTAKLSSFHTQQGKNVWETDNVVLWQYGAKLAFYAWAPAVCAARTVPQVDAAAGEMTFSYTVPATVASQTDIMCGFYSGAPYSGDSLEKTSLANLTFTHPLTAVRFVVKGSAEGLTINSIAIHNVFASGTCTATSGSYSWVGAGNASFVENIQTTPSADGAQIGSCFILVPQLFASESGAEIQINVTGQAGPARTLSFSLDGKEWKQGYTTTYGVDLVRGAVMELSTVAKWVDDVNTIHLKDAIDLSEPRGTANSYIVPPMEGYYKFPAVKGNSTESVGAVKSVKVLWETGNTSSVPQTGQVVGNASFFDGYVYLLSSGALPGNAVIAAYSGEEGTGDILWSWHIWKAESPEDSADPVPEMDRNLGALAVSAEGLTYQWGRKDPFLGTGMASTGTFYEDATTTTVLRSIQTPATAYNLSGMDWLSTPDDGLWMAAKTIYDPCPAGYTVSSAFFNPIPANRAAKNAVRCQKLTQYEYHFMVEEAGGELLYLLADEQSQPVHISSYKQIEGSNEKEAVGYSVQYSIDGGTTWAPFDGDLVTLGAESNLRGLLASGNAGHTETTAVDVFSGPRQNIVNSKYFWSASEEPLADNVDLSKIMSSTGETVDATTANCYVVQKPGTYKFPCVYGNSVQGGIRTHAGYNTESGTLKTFLASDGGAMSCPEILKDISAAHYKATVLWQDAWEKNVAAGEAQAQGLITSVSVSGNNDDWPDCPFITFTTANRNNLVEGNAVIALYDDTDNDGVLDSNENVLWSWHIWVCQRTVGKGRDVWRFDSNSHTYLMPMNLGLCQGIDCKFTETHPSVKLRFVQDDSEESAVITLSRPDVSNPAYPGLTYYQWGRKDPFPPVVNKAGINVAKTVYDIDGNVKSFVTEAWDSNVISNGISHPFTFCLSDKMDQTYLNLWSLDNSSSSQDGDSIYAADKVETKKTVYDPCPPGYKMPDMWLLAGLKTQSQLQTRKYCIWFGQYGFAFGDSDSSVDYNLFIPFVSAIGADGTFAGYMNDRAYVWTGTPGGPDGYASKGTYGGRYVLFVKGGTETWSPNNGVFLKSDFRNRGFAVRPAEAFNHDNHGGQY